MPPLSRYVSDSMPCALVVGRANEARRESLCRSMYTLKIPCIFAQGVIDSVPIPTKVAQVVRARMSMDWEELSQNTLELGDRWPMLLAMVRAAEAEGDAERCAEIERDKEIFMKKKARVQRQLRSTKVKQDNWTTRSWSPPQMVAFSRSTSARRGP